RMPYVSSAGRNGRVLPEHSIHQKRRRSQNMRLREIMVAPVITIAPDESAEAAWARMEFERVRHLVVTEGNRVLGVLSDRDLGGREGDQVREGRTVGELMTPQVATAKPGTT